MTKQQGFLRNLAGQCTIVLFFPAAFLMLAFLSGMGPRTHGIRHLGAAVLLAAAVVFMLFLWLFLLVRDKRSLESLKSKISRERWLYGILLLSGILRSFSLNVMQRWDAGEYYYRLGTACENFDFTWEAFLEQFSLCGHPTLGFAPIYAIGDYLAPRRIWGMELMNLALTLAAIACIYQILKKILPEAGDRRLGLYILLVSFCPLFLGTFQQFNPDTGIALFAIFVIHSCIYRQYLLLFFWSCVVVQTKETGIVMQAGLVLGLVFYDFFTEKKALKVRIKTVWNNPCTWITGASVLLQLGYMKLIGGLTKWASPEQQQFRWDSDGMNCFGFRGEYIWTKWKQFFILNFNWIYVLLIILGILLVILGRKYIRRLPQGMVLLWSVSGSLFLFLNLYITGALARYNLFCDLVLAITAIAVIEKILPENFRHTTAALCAGLMLLQSFLTVDPVSRLVFPHVKTGTVDMLYMQMPSEELYYGDPIVYNYQYTFIDKALDSILADTYQGGRLNIVHFGDTYEDGAHFGGNWYQDWIPYRISWDKEAKKRVHYENDDTVRINVFGEEMLNESFENGTAVGIDTGVLIFLPQFEYPQEECLDKLRPFFEIGDKKTWRSIWGCVDYYELSEK